MNSRYTNWVFKHILFFGLLLSPVFVFAQPANDECEGAIEIFDIVSCSEPRAFTNDGANPSNFTGNSCTSNGGNDVWFKFTAIATDLTITVIGNTGDNSAGGSLRQPEAELYFDNNCTGSFQVLQCERGTASDIVELYQGGIVPGESYLIRVQGRNGAEGTFQMCINNYFPPVDPGSDLEIASVLCDKSQFVIQQIDGTGNDNDEARGTCLDVPGFGVSSEQSSTWFTWIAANDGPLAFIIDPLNPSDDIDFVVYELPNGINNPDGKIALRCMATACVGPTGLSETSNDLEEDPGCDGGEDGFVRAIDMEEGKAYGVLINNFSNTGNGFSMEFSGAGEFLGPDPQIDAIISTTTNVICVGDEVTFSGENSSFALGQILEYEWTFGVGAESVSVTGAGPHTVSYTEPGDKSVVLTITTDLGCKVSDISASVVTVEACCDINGIEGIAEVTDVICGEGRGAIDLTLTSDSEINSIQWSNNASTEDLTNIDPDDYSVTVTNLATCTNTFNFSVDSTAPFVLMSNITQPTCNGGRDGIIELNVQDGVDPIQIDFGDGFDNERTLTNLAVGDYPVTVVDGNGCSEEIVFEVRELTLELDSAAAVMTDPSCFGLTNGNISLNFVNGLAPYNYDWNDGMGIVTRNTLEDVPAGTYTVNVLDQNLCEGEFEFNLIEPAELALTLDTLSVSCSGQTDGAVTAIVDGGTGDYRYNWSNNQTTIEITDLAPGTYMVTVLDENQCEIQGTALVIEPEGIDIQVTDAQDVLCFGDQTGVITVSGIGGSPAYEYSTDGITYQNSPSLSDLGAGTYTVMVRDQRGCVSQTEASIGEPEQLTVDAGESLTVDLGFTGSLNAVTTPFFRDVTFDWSNPEYLSCSDCPNPVASPPIATTFVVTITDETNCTATDSIRFFINPNRPLFIPNGFSPNFDGNNDYFTIYGGPAIEMINELNVFDRWGNLIYKTTNVSPNVENLGWDGRYEGKDLPSGVFAFVAKVLFIDGVVEIYHGDITLIR